MSDIVKRLRQEAERAALCVDSGHDDICAEAADEIERLRAERDAAIMDADMQAREAGNMEHDARVLMSERDAAVSLAERHMDEKHRTLRQAAEDWNALQQRIKTAKAERDRLRTALQSVLDACDQGRMVERGAGGMTLEAQIRRSVYNNVPAWPIEEARAALGGREA
jgi:DNA repair exonuclease SbcCD ATPase subunit